MSSPLNVMVALALTAVTVPCASQSQTDQLQLEVVPESALLTGQTPAPAPEVNGLAASSTRSFFDTSRSTSSWLGSAIQIENSYATGTGQYTKPKIRVGLPSDTMRNFLNSAGLPAEKCQLPMVRAKTKLAEGDASGTLWLFARCTFR